MKTDIKSLSPHELACAFAGLGERSFRAIQAFKWLHRGVKTFDEMTDLPVSLRDRLKEKFVITYPEIVKKQVSRLDGTIKYLWKLSDANTIESVVMSYEHGNTVCISTQVGCRMGCAFCASTLGGLVRNLSPSEMLDQIIFSSLDSGKTISNVVLMGIGEPLDNFDNVIRFLTLVNDKDGLGIGMRHISLSTCGIAEKVDKLGDFNLQLTLSVSLHAADDEMRSALMPINKKYDVSTLLNSCGRYFEKTGRRISYEYAMIDAVNDTREHAEKLSARLKGTPGHVNLILLNNVTERPLKASSRSSLNTFTQILEKNGINYTIRRKLGGDIDASCGQLRRSLKHIQASKASSAFCSPCDGTQSLHNLTGTCTSLEGE